jgi:Skp family chaperone for outer membrane proteins
MIFSTQITRKILSTVITVFFLSVGFGQRSQNIAYVDMDYILAQVPEYVKAESDINEKIALWNLALTQLRSEIDQMKKDFAAQKVLYTDELLVIKQDEIYIKELELSQAETAFFGPNGQLVRERSQLVKPIQDKVFTAIQKLVEQNRYDFVIDKSSDLVLLYSNKKYDISDLVLREINIKTNQELAEIKQVEQDSIRLAKNQLLLDRKNQAEANRQAKLQAKQERDSILSAQKAARLKYLEEKRNQSKDSIN